ncbi:MAG: ATP-binding protein [Clostridiales bacterium]|nr:ATP-binding protein [Clostridiales bacterium]
MKKLILVTSPPACGKTYVAKQLAKALNHVVYLDKDTLIVLSKQIFKVANEPYNRSSDFFEKNIRDYEYEAILDLAMDALEYDDIVLINAPFTREVRNPEYIRSLRAALSKKQVQLCIIWVVTDPEVCHQRMIARNSDRDTWKLAHWDEYISKCDFSIPKGIGDPAKKKELILFYNSNEKEFQASMKEMLEILQK